ncbi:FlgD immunoglobulin-like domain containing protein [Candidatus Ruminimicrobium bovinum]|uniref:FlgD immunoglobulin-like domain containing protein n=1 Tax=Candidatus Ruminimicrobium bovinum TaxID=3242779 RepID=UPI0039B999EE
MNKLNKFLLVLLFVSFCFVSAFADRTIVSSSTFKLTGRIVGNGIQHNAINSISSIDKFLNAKVLVNFGTAENVDFKLKYYINNDSSTIYEVKKDSIYHNNPFYISTDIDANEGDTVNYQLEGVFTYRDAKSPTVTKTSTFCWPVDASENPYYQKAVIASSVSAAVDGSAGKTVVLQSGDQSKTDTYLFVPAGAYSGSKTFAIKELPLTDYITPSNAPASSSIRIVNPNKPVKLYSVEIDGSLEQDIMFNISYPELTSRDNFTLKKGADLSSITENVPIDSVDVEKKIVSAKINKTGYYALFTDINLVDSDYRPARRVIVKARAQSRGDVFAFNYLKEGDSVKIYNVNGKKVRTITSGNDDGFSWDGKDDSGRYVESGTYIYQIKVKGKSKLISGTIAFVK